jgi:hypothetical protein
MLEISEGERDSHCGSFSLAPARRHSHWDSDTDLLTINDDDFTRLEDHQAYHSDDDFVPAGKKASKVCTRI